MQTVYVAGPMTGREDFNREAFFMAESRLKQVGYNVINPARYSLDYPKCGRSYRDVLAESVKMLVEQADGIALLDGWEESKGVSIELDVAERLELPVSPLDSWIESVTLQYEPETDGGESWRRMGEVVRQNIESNIAFLVKERLEIGRTEYKSDVLGFQGDPLDHLGLEVIDSSVYWQLAKRQQKWLLEEIAARDSRIEALENQLRTMRSAIK